eukprot:scaffold62006_cov33-Phaeocystis_antarctica.AAC.3
MTRGDRMNSCSGGVGLGLGFRLGLGFGFGLGLGLGDPASRHGVARDAQLSIYLYLLQGKVVGLTVAWELAVLVLDQLDVEVPPRLGEGVG